MALIGAVCYFPKLLKSQKFCGRQTRSWLGLRIFRMAILASSCHPGWAYVTIDIRHRVRNIIHIEASLHAASSNLIVYGIPL